MNEASGEETQAWIIVADRSNMEHVAKHGVFGLNQKSVLGRVRGGDKLVAYIRGEKVFAGLGEVTKGHYLDDDPIFDGGLFPERIGVHLTVLPPSESKDIWYFLDDLRFPSDKTRWSASLVGGIRRIPMEDYALFASKLSTGN